MQAAVEFNYGCNYVPEWQQLLRQGGDKKTTKSDDMVADSGKLLVSPGKYNQLSAMDSQVIQKFATHVIADHAGCWPSSVTHTSSYGEAPQSS